jgi:hypothetical protein
MHAFTYVIDAADLKSLRSIHHQTKGQTMSAKFFAIALIATASAAHSPAFAQHHRGEIGGVVVAQPLASQRTRAQVHEEVLQARRSGTLPAYGENEDHGRGTMTAPATAVRATRSEVRSAYLQAARAGQLPSYREGADTDHRAIADPKAMARSRADVHAEALYAVRSGLTVGGEI